MLWEFLEFCSRRLSLQNNWYSPQLSTQAVGLETSTQPSVTPTRITPPTTSHSFLFFLSNSLLSFTPHIWVLPYFQLFPFFSFLSYPCPVFCLEICHSPISLLLSLSRPLSGSFDVSSYLLSHTTCSVLSRTGLDSAEVH